MNKKRKRNESEPTLLVILHIYAHWFVRITWFECIMWKKSIIQLHLCAEVW